MTFYERILRWHREWNEDEEAIQRLDARASAAIGATARDGTTASCRDYVHKKGKYKDIQGYTQVNRLGLQCHVTAPGGFMSAMPHPRLTLSN